MRRIFVNVAHVDGYTVTVNPDQVLYVEPRTVEHPDGEVTWDADESRLIFAGGTFLEVVQDVGTVTEWLERADG